MSVFLLHDTLSNFHVNKKSKYQHVYFANIPEKKKIIIAYEKLKQIWKSSLNKIKQKWK